MEYSLTDNNTTFLGTRNSLKETGKANASKAMQWTGTASLFLDQVFIYK
jgi:hypothetical protein